MNYTYIAFHKSIIIIIDSFEIIILLIPLKLLLKS